LAAKWLAGDYELREFVVGRARAPGRRLEYARYMGASEKILTVTSSDNGPPDEESPLYLATSRQTATTIAPITTRPIWTAKSIALMR
jgi:hypothetical protein